MCTVGTKQQQSKSTITKLNMISFTIYTFRPFKMLYNSRPDNNRNRPQRPKFVWSLFNINKSICHWKWQNCQLPAYFDWILFLIQTLHKPVSKIQWAHWFNNGAKLTWKGFSPVWTSWCLLSFELSTKACMISPWKTKPDLDNDDTIVENNNNLLSSRLSLRAGCRELPPAFRIVTPQLLS